MLSPASFRGEFRTDLRARALYSEGAGIYRIVPEAVALPTDEADVQTLIRWAGQNQVALTPRGAGSSVTGSNVGPGVIVDLTRIMPRTLHVNASDRMARTSAAIRWGELSEAAKVVGLRLPPDPSSGPFATLGGMASTNASGARSLSFGSMRRWIRGARIITVDGELLELRRGVPPSAKCIVVDRFEREVRPSLTASAPVIRRAFPQTRKNSAGYALDAWLTSGDLLDLFVGSEGTLGIITEIEWELGALAASRAGLRVDLASLDHLEPAVEALHPLRPSAIELLDRTFLDLASQNQPGLTGQNAHQPETILLVEFERESHSQVRGAVGDAVRRLKGIAMDVETALTPEEETRHWKLRHAASPIIADLPRSRRSLQVIEDACVPIARMGEYIAAVRAAAARVEVPIVIFGHAGDGNIHVNLIPETDKPGWDVPIAMLQREITAEVIRLGGTTTGEHGDGRIRAGNLESLYGAEVMELFHLVKRTFDPEWILNPGVKLPVPSGSTATALHDLKVGHEAAAIPDDISARLREIERRGEYRPDRLRDLPESTSPFTVHS
jgi:FAD/FMN-containing dehydrogenase